MVDRERSISDIYNCVPGSLITLFTVGVPNFSESRPDAGDSVEENADGVKIENADVEVPIIANSTNELIIEFIIVLDQGNGRETENFEGLLIGNNDFFVVMDE